MAFISIWAPSKFPNQKAWITAKDNELVDFPRQLFTSFQWECPNTTENHGKKLLWNIYVMLVTCKMCGHCERAVKHFLLLYYLPFISVKSRQKGITVMSNERLAHRCLFHWRIQFNIPLLDYQPGYGGSFCGLSKQTTEVAEQPACREGGIQ